MTKEQVEKLIITLKELINCIGYSRDVPNFAVKNVYDLIQDLEKVWKK